MDAINSGWMQRSQEVVDFKGDKIMFLEVYAVNLDNYSKETDLSKTTKSAFY